MQICRKIRGAIIRLLFVVCLCLTEFVALAEIPGLTRTKVIGHGHDMKLTGYRDAGLVDHQVPPSWWVDN